MSIEEAARAVIAAYHRMIDEDDPDVMGGPIDDLQAAVDALDENGRRSLLELIGENERLRSGRRR